MVRRTGLIVILVLGTVTLAAIRIPTNNTSQPQTRYQQLMQKMLNDYQTTYEQQQREFDQLFDARFFSEMSDPFQQMEEMHELMEQTLQDLDEQLVGPFNDQFKDWYEGRFGGGQASDVQLRQDDKTISYTINLSGLDVSKLDVQVSRQQIRLASVQRQDVEKQDKQAQVRLSEQYHIQRVFPVPTGVDWEHPQIQRDKERIMIRFNKLKH